MRLNPQKVYGVRNGEGCISHCEFSEHSLDESVNISSLSFGVTTFAGSPYYKSGASLIIAFYRANKQRRVVGGWEVCLSSYVGLLKLYPPVIYIA